MDNHALHDSRGSSFPPSTQPGPSAPHLPYPSENSSVGSKLPNLKAPPPNQQPPPYQQNYVALPYPPASAPGSYRGPETMAWQQPGYPPPVPQAGPYYGPSGPGPYTVPVAWPPGSYNAPPRGAGGYGGAPGPYPGSYPQPPPQMQQQQQTTTVVIGRQAPVIHQPIVFAQSFTCHYVLACFTCWFCNPLFGGIAFILAAVGSCNARTDQQSARQLGRASIGVSIAGIIVTIIVVIVVVSVVASNGGYSYISSGSSGYGSYNSYGSSSAYSCYTYYGYSVSCSNCYYSSCSRCYSSLGYAVSCPYNGKR